MRRGGVLAMAAVGACFALTSVASPSQGAPGLAAKAPKPSAATVAASCSYPPVKTPLLSLTSSVSKVKAGVPFTLSGTLTVNGCPLKQRPVGLYASSKPAGPFRLIWATATNASGSYRFDTVLRATTSYRVSSAASLTYNAATSNVVTVTKK